MQGNKSFITEREKERQQLQITTYKGKLLYLFTCGFSNTWWSFKNNAGLNQVVHKYGLQNTNTISPSSVETDNVSNHNIIISPYENIVLITEWIHIIIKYVK